MGLLPSLLRAHDPSPHIRR